MVFDLKGEAVKYNDTVGTIVAWDDAKQKWKVKMDADRQVYRLKPANVCVYEPGTDSEIEA